MFGERVFTRGFVEGGEPWRIDNAISDEPQATERLGAKARVTSGRVKTHCRYWIARDLFYVETTNGEFHYLRTGDQPRGRRTIASLETTVETRASTKADGKKQDNDGIEPNAGFRRSLASLWRAILRADPVAIFGSRSTRLLERHEGDRLAQPGFVGSAYECGGLVFVAMNPGNGRDGLGKLDLLQYDALKDLRDCCENDAESSFVGGLTPVLERTMPQFKITKNFVRPILFHAGLELTQVAYVNLLKWRTKKSSGLAKLFARSWEEHTREQFNLLKPGIVIALGAETGKVLEDLYREKLSDLRYFERVPRAVGDNLYQGSRDAIKKIGSWFEENRRPQWSSR
jgi:hypothetical protein